MYQARIIGTHSVQTFKHNTLINELLIMQFYLCGPNMLSNCITGISVTLSCPRVHFF